MLLDKESVRQRLRRFDFTGLFVEELGWDRHAQTLNVPLHGEVFSLSAVAHKRGFVAFQCEPQDNGRMPDYAARRKIEKQVGKAVYEHLVVYTDADRTTQVWEWVRREPGRPLACRTHVYHVTQPGDALIQKLQSIAFSLEEEEGLTLVDVTSRIRAGLDVDKVTKRFYDHFQKEHAAFHKFIRGIPNEWMQRWHTSVTLNRLMFIYFIQKKGFLNGDPDYLLHKLQESKGRGRDRYYRGFLCALFFEGLAKPEAARPPEARQLIGDVPYLNGGLFMPDRVEEEYGDAIDIPDSAFERLFGFFEQYRWHLDERPLRKDNEINPDVLGYIFEKYINAIQPGEQKAKGAYYSKEDITEYISKNTVIPYLFDAARTECRIAFDEGGFVWQLAQADPDRYIHEPVRRGVIDQHGSIIPESALPDFVQVGMHDPKARMFDRRYNLTEADLRDAQGNKLTLPTETWREYVERRSRCLDLRQKLRAGDIRDINDFITYNLDIRQFAQDVIENCEGPDLLRAFWKAIKSITVLDPACGSGAFLFAALNILEDLYEACLDRMQVFVDELERSGEKYHPDKFSDFRKALEQVAKHPNRKYYVFKSIILNNLYGVDIMEEAVEICKLRLFLKLAAQVEPDPSKPNMGLEPLPDIDFNIRAGNTLVGFATYDEVKKAVSGTLDFEDAMSAIEGKAREVDELFGLFREMQEEPGGEITPENKHELRGKLKPLEDELNDYLAQQYGIDRRQRSEAFRAWLASHKAFHWFVEFHRIMTQGGFSVVTGNPPYVEYTKRERQTGKRVKDEYGIKGYSTETCGNLYAFTMERSLALMCRRGRFGMIAPVSCVASATFAPLMGLFLRRQCWISTYSNRPAKLFYGVEQRLNIVLAGAERDTTPFATPYQHWYESERHVLFPRLVYCAASLWAHTAMPVKTGVALAESVFRKIVAAGGALRFVSTTGNCAAYFHDGPTYWVRCLPFQPNAGVRSDRSNHYHRVQAVTAANALLISAVMNSSSFYFFFKMVSNCRDLGQKEWENFPVGRMPEGVRIKLVELGHLLEEALRSTAVLCTRRYPSGDVEYQEYYPAKAKPTIDQIDSVLADHYGFTDEELDFIINYDIKYRMGLDEGEVES